MSNRHCGAATVAHVHYGESGHVVRSAAVAGGPGNLAPGQVSPHSAGSVPSAARQARCPREERAHGRLRRRRGGARPCPHPAWRPAASAPLSFRPLAAGSGRSASPTRHGRQGGPAAAAGWRLWGVGSAAAGGRGGGAPGVGVGTGGGAAGSRGRAAAGAGRVPPCAGGARPWSTRGRVLQPSLGRARSCPSGPGSPSAGGAVSAASTRPGISLRPGFYVSKVPTAPSEPSIGWPRWVPSRVSVCCGSGSAVGGAAPGLR